MSGNIKTVGVVGTGVIGSSWIGLFLAKGLHVIVSDPAPDAEKKLSDYLKGIWPLLERSGLSPGASLSNYEFVGSSLAGRYESIDFVQEVSYDETQHLVILYSLEQNVPERIDIKNKIIAEIDAGTRSDVIIASSSSGLPSSRFVKDCQKNPSRVLIGHPFNPPHIVPLVEIVPHPGTAEEFIQIALEFYQSLGKHPIVVRQETPGFVANRLQAAINNEAFSLVQRGVVTAKELGQRIKYVNPIFC
jgi:3-hydroxyacyl-CoA dehydrogenase